MPSGCTTCTATCGSGARTTGTTTTGERPATGLAGYLRELGVRRVHVCGLARDYCVRWTAEDAADLVRRGMGSLVASAYGDDPAWLGAVIETFGAWNGRLYLGSAKIADMVGGSGMALPWLLHGGPGRAGGGEELGGLSGLRLYQRRTAVQGDRGILNRILPKPDSE